MAAPDPANCEEFVNIGFVSLPPLKAVLLLKRGGAEILCVQYCLSNAIQTRYHVVLVKGVHGPRSTIL
jgi:hypothetical protein